MTHGSFDSGGHNIPDFFEVRSWREQSEWTWTWTQKGSEQNTSEVKNYRQDEDKRDSFKSLKTIQGLVGVCHDVGKEVLVRLIYFSDVALLFLFPIILSC